MTPEHKKLTRFLRSESPTLYLSRREVIALEKDLRWVNNKRKALRRILKGVERDMGSEDDDG